MRAPLLAGLALALALPLQATAQARQDDTPLDRLTRRDQLSGWEAVGRVDIGDDRFCTGVLIAPDLVLTAGHCLVSKPDFKPVDPAIVRFRAGLSDGKSVAERRVIQTVIHPEYYDQKAKRFDHVETDIALMKLESPIPTNIAAPFAIAEQDVGRSVSVVSYARGRSEALSWQRSCSVIGVWPGAAGFTCDVTYGASGAPVFDTSRRRPMIVSVISRGRFDDGKPVSYGPIIGPPIAELKEALRTANGVNMAGGGLASAVQRTENARFVKPNSGGARFVKP